MAVSYFSRVMAKPKLCKELPWKCKFQGGQYKFSGEVPVNTLDVKKS